MATVSFISGVGCGASLRKTLNKPLEVFGFCFICFLVFWLLLHIFFLKLKFKHTTHCISHAFLVTLMCIILLCAIKKKYKHFQEIVFFPQEII